MAPHFAESLVDSLAKIQSYPELVELVELKKKINDLRDSLTDLEQEYVTKLDDAADLIERENLQDMFKVKKRTSPNIKPVPREEKKAKIRDFVKKQPQFTLKELYQGTGLIDTQISPHVKNWFKKVDERGREHVYEYVGEPETSGRRRK